tara:strand:+ start:1094 stop:1495 length:402 start_codon:yes stop_codon:yes gene_type:complete
MDEVLIGCLLGCFVLNFAVLRHALVRMTQDKAEAIARAESLRNDLGSALQNMVGALDFDIPDIHTIRDTIEESIQGIMGTFHQPTGQDMILGAISQLVMSKVMPQMPPAMQNIAEQVLPPAIQPAEAPVDNEN